MLPREVLLGRLHRNRRLWDLVPNLASAAVRRQVVKQVLAWAKLRLGVDVSALALQSLIDGQAKGRNVVGKLRTLGEVGSLVLA